jgi:hypothetical protein
MPLHQFSHSLERFIRGQLGLGGALWSAFASLPFERGHTFTFLPPAFPADLAGRVDEALLGRYQDQTSFEEEHSYIRDHIRRKTGNAAVFGLNTVRPDDIGRLTRFGIVTLRSGFSQGYSKLLVLAGTHVDIGDIQDAMCLACCPFILGALIETGRPSPLDFVVAAAAEEATSDTLRQKTVGVIVEAYRGEGTLFWTRGRADSVKVQNLPSARENARTGSS